MGTRRQGTALAGLEVHDLLAEEAAPLPVVGQHGLPTLGERRQRDPEAVVGGGGAADALEEQVDRGAPVERGQLGGDVGEHAGLGRGAGPLDQVGEAALEALDDLDRVACGVHPDDGVARAEQQAVDRRQQHAAEVVGGVVGLHPHAEHARPAHRVAAPGDHPQRRGGLDEVACPHELGHRGGHLRGDRAVEPRRPLGSEARREHALAQLADGEPGDGRQALAVEAVEHERGDVVVDQRRVDDLAHGDIGQGPLSGDPFALGSGSHTSQLVARLRVARPAQQLPQVGEGEHLAAQRGAVGHAAAAARSAGTSCSVSRVANRVGSPAT